MSPAEQNRDAARDAASLATQRQLILNLEKVLRSYRLYEARGVQYEAHVNELAGQAALATELEEVTVNLSPFGPYLSQEEPPSDGDYARQWFTLFEEGARQIVFMPGIDGRELRELLHIICSEVEDNEDIVTALWRKELSHVQIYVARVLIRSIEGVSEQSFSIRDELSRWKTLLSASASTDAATDRGGEDQELIQLSPDDFRVLALEGDTFDWCTLSTEVSSEVRESRRKQRLIENVDKEIGDFARFLDLANDVGEQADQIILDVIAGMTRMGNAEDIDRMICTVAKRGGDSARSLRKLIEQGDGLDMLLPLIEAAPSSFEDSLAAIAEIDAEAVSALLEKVDQTEVRDTLSDFVATAEEAPMHYHSARLLSEDVDEAVKAVDELIKMGTDESFMLALGGFKSGKPSVRRQVIRRVFERYNPTLSYMIHQALEDVDKSIRIVTLRFIGENGSTSLLRELISMMKQRDFMKRDYTERVAFVRAIGRHTRLPVINSFLCEILLEYRLFGSREMIEYQMEVARLLLRSNNPEANAAIKKVLSRWSVSDEVKQAIRAEQVRLSESGAESRSPTKAGAKDSEDQPVDYLAEAMDIIGDDDLDIEVDD